MVDRTWPLVRALAYAPALGLVRARARARAGLSAGVRGGILVGILIGILASVMVGASGVIAPTALAQQSPAQQSPAQQTLAGQAQQAEQGGWAAFDRLIDEASRNLVAEPNTALGLAEQAYALAVEAPSSARKDVALASSWALQANALSDLGRSAESLPLAVKALELARTHREKTRAYGQILLSAGSSAVKASDFAVGLPALHEAYELLDELGETDLVVRALRSLGVTYFLVERHQLASEYTQKALALLGAEDETVLYLYNNIAGSEVQLGNFERGLELYNKALERSASMDSDLIDGLLNYNVADLHRYAGDLDEADRIAVRSETLLEGFPMRRRFPRALRAQIAVKRGGYDDAKYYFDVAFEGLDISTTAAEFREFHRDAAIAYRHVGEFELALDHLTAFKRLDDQRRNVVAEFNLATLGVEFEVAERQLEIERLERSALEGEFRLAQMLSRHNSRMTQGIGLGSVLLIGFLTFQYISMRRHRDQAEKNTQSLREANAQLAEANSAFERAESANSAKSQFLANMSHEVRTPLNGVLGMAQALSSENLSPRHKDMIATILDSGKVLMAILNDVLDLSKIEAGKMELSPTPGDLTAALDQICRLFQPRAADVGVDLQLEADDEQLRSLVFDSVRVRQCVSNLVSNAVKFTEQGSIRVSADMTDPVDGFATVFIRVRDTGIGMSPQALQRVFVDFSQADASTSRTYGGTGLGMAITRRLARMMGGDVTVESVEGQGSTFTLTLVAAISEHAGTHAEPVDQTVGEHLADTRILVVDDNAVNRKVARVLLESHNVVIDEAENGKEALDRLQAQDFDIVLLDVQMPVMDGRETIKAIRACDEAWSDVTVLALTAEAMAGAREELLGLGMDGFVTKPIARDELLQEITRLLGEGAARRLDAGGTPQGGAESAACAHAANAPVCVPDIGTDDIGTDDTCTVDTRKSGIGQSRIGMGDVDATQAVSAGQADITGVAPLITGLRDGPLSVQGQTQAGRRILVVDDVAICRQAPRALLQAHGAQVDVASDGLEALECMQHGTYDAVLMDILMPQLSGLDASRRIRTSQHPWALTPIIAMTADRRARVRADIDRAGMDGCVLKPVSPDVLIETIDMVIERAGQNDGRAVHLSRLGQGDGPSDVTIAAMIEELCAAQSRGLDSLTAFLRDEAEPFATRDQWTVEAEHMVHAFLQLLQSQSHVKDGPAHQGDDTQIVGTPGEAGEVNLGEVAAGVCGDGPQDKAGQAGGLDMSGQRLWSDIQSGAQSDALINLARECTARAPSFGFDLIGVISSDLSEHLAQSQFPLCGEDAAVVERYLLALHGLLQRRVSGEGGPHGDALRNSLAS